MEWRAVVGFEGYFEVSDSGLFRSVERIVANKNGKTRIMKPKILTGYPDPKGYLKVRTSIDKEKITFKIHREVAKAFIHNPDNKEQVDHIDGNKSNNAVSNLRWVTNRENFDLSVENGLRNRSFAALSEYQNKPEVKKKRNEASVMACRKTTYCYDLSGNLLHVYESTADAARNLHIQQGGVSMCCRNEMKTYKGMVFRYG